MNSESKIKELYHMIFEKSPNSDYLQELINIYTQNNDSLSAVEETIRNSYDFKNLTIILEKKLEVVELYYSILHRKPDLDGLNYFTNQVIQNKKSFSWVEEQIKNSDEYKSM